MVTKTRFKVQLVPLNSLSELFRMIKSETQARCIEFTFGILLHFLKLVLTSEAGGHLVLALYVCALY